MDRFECQRGPIVVGGVGGSGTRLVAQVLLDLGFHLGNDLNASFDNLWFTLLLMRPRWFNAEPSAIAGEVDVALTILGRALRGEALSAAETALATAAAEETRRVGYSLTPAGAGTGDWNVEPGESWAHARLASLLEATRAAPPAAVGWGWKEPNSHVFLPELDRAFDRLRFVLVVRHGLDMAFSDNRHQLVNWGARYGVGAGRGAGAAHGGSARRGGSAERRVGAEGGDSAPKGRHDPRQALEFWVAANQRAISYGAAHLRDRFLIVNYDRMCRSPEAEVRRLCGFVDREPPVEQLRRLARLPRPPASMGRYKRHPIEQFDAAHLDAVRELGFET